MTPEQESILARMDALYAEAARKWTKDINDAFFDIFVPRDAEPPPAAKPEIPK
jgi:hypothetical protein